MKSSSPTPSTQCYRNWNLWKQKTYLREKSPPPFGLCKGVSVILATLSPDDSPWPARLCNETEVVASIRHGVRPPNPQLSLLVVFLSLEAHNFFHWVDPRTIYPITSYELVRQSKQSESTKSYHAAWAWAMRLSELELNARGPSRPLDEYWEKEDKSAQRLSSDTNSRSSIGEQITCHPLNKLSFTFDDSLLVAPWPCADCRGNTLSCDCSNGIASAVKSMSGNLSKAYADYKCDEESCPTCTVLPGLPILIAELGVASQWRGQYGGVVEKIQGQQFLKGRKIGSLEKECSGKRARNSVAEKGLDSAVPSVEGGQPPSTGQVTSLLPVSKAFEVIDTVKFLKIFRMMCQDELKRFKQALKQRKKYCPSHHTSLHPLVDYLYSVEDKKQKATDYEVTTKGAVLDKLVAMIEWSKEEDKAKLRKYVQPTYDAMTVEMTSLLRFYPNKRAFNAFLDIAAGVYHNMVARKCFVQYANALLRESVAELTITFSTRGAFSNQGFSSRDADALPAPNEAKVSENSSSSRTLSECTNQSASFDFNTPILSAQHIFSSVVSGDHSDSFEVDRLKAVGREKCLRPAHNLMACTAVNACIVCSYHSKQRSYGPLFVRLVKHDVRGAARIAHVVHVTHQYDARDIAMQLVLDEAVIVLEIVGEERVGTVYAIKTPKFEFVMSSSDWLEQIRAFKPTLIVQNVDLRASFDFGRAINRLVEVSEQLCFSRIISIVEPLYHTLEERVEWIVFERRLREHMELLAKMASKLQISPK